MKQKTRKAKPKEAAEVKSRMALEGLIEQIPKVDEVLEEAQIALEKSWVPRLVPVCCGMLEEYKPGHLRVKEPCERDLCMLPLPQCCYGCCARAYVGMIVDGEGAQPQEHPRVCAMEKKMGIKR